MPPFFLNVNWDQYFHLFCSNSIEYLPNNSYQRGDWKSSSWPTCLHPTFSNSLKGGGEDVSFQILSRGGGGSENVSIVVRLLKINEPFFLIACILENISTQGECDAGDRVEEQAEWGAKPGKPGIIIITIRDLHHCPSRGSRVTQIQSVGYK